MTNHITKRGDRYQYVRRVPSDLQDRFPSPVISRSLKTSNKKHANLLAISYDFRAEQLFTRLRSAMLDAITEKRLINLHLKGRLDDLDAIATGNTDEAFTTSYSNYQGIAAMLADKPFESIPEDEQRILLTHVANTEASFARGLLASKDACEQEIQTGLLAKQYRQEYGIDIPPSQQKSITLHCLNNNVKTESAAAALFNGDWSLYEALKDRVETELAQPHFFFTDVLAHYREWYLQSKTTIKSGTISDMEVECRVLLEIIGNRSIADVNTMETVTTLKTILRKYPLNKQQRFGDKSIHTIIKSKGYAVISNKTANEYLKRLKAVIDFANKSKMLNAANVAVGELFQTEKAEEEQRPAYDDADIERLIGAICSQPLWGYGEPKPERFWLILVALFHGLRLGNIVALTKADICQTDRGTWIFRLRQGKTKASVRSVAICDTLLLLGFLEWVEGLKRERLFQDTSASFSKWYNRDEQRSDGYNVQGFETKYVTADKGKCLYSLRHTFAGNVFDVSTDFKITSDMMGHSTGKSVTARYTKRTKTETLKEVTNKMHLGHLDLDRLETRALELFGHM